MEFLKGLALSLGGVLLAIGLVAFLAYIDSAQAAPVKHDGFVRELKSPNGDRVQLFCDAASGTLIVLSPPAGYGSGSSVAIASRPDFCGQ